MSQPKRKSRSVRTNALRGHNKKVAKGLLDLAIGGSWVTLAREVSVAWSKRAKTRRQSQWEKLDTQSVWWLRQGHVASQPRCHTVTTPQMGDSAFG